MNVKKEEVYYKFIFPDNNNIKTQTVRDLIDNDHIDSPSDWHVIAYDQLDEKNPAVKHYIEDYLKIPKYFNLRVYADDVNGTKESGKQRQFSGVSLVVSNSPECIVEPHCWVKFNSTYNGVTKVVYCSVMISSGPDDIPLEDFYFNWNLPDEVLIKSGLRDSIVNSKFHTNWYFTQADQVEYSSHDYGNIPIGREKRVFNKHYFKQDLTYCAQVKNAVDPPTQYTHLQEDNKRGFIDLEVTRRILLYPMSNYGSVSIPTVVSGTGLNTVLSYYPPQEYLNNKPLPIKRYDLLRAALCGRDPYGDCETVLVMWVADDDPMNYADGNVAALNSLHWHQYAIPISVRCCIKNDSSIGDSYSTKRFMFSYPHMYNPSSQSTTEEFPYLWRFHTKRNSKYVKDVFKEALFLPDLVNYSQDYIIAYQNTGTASIDPFNIQKHLFIENIDFKALYIKKAFRQTTMTNNQCYYIFVDESLYSKNYNLNVCFTESSDTSVTFKPRDHIRYEDYKEIWYLAEEPWSTGPEAKNNAIDNSWFIALFDADNEKIHIDSGVLTFKNASNLKQFLSDSTSVTTSNPPIIYTWEDLYISSLGISQNRNFSNADHLLGGIGEQCIPLGYLDNHIQINGVDYGSNYQKVVVGFKKAFDYKYNDSCHFKYIDNEYKLVRCNEFYSSEYELVPDSENIFTIYYMDYPNT